MDLASKLPFILPLAIQWAEEKSAEIQCMGHRLNPSDIKLAKCVGVSNPENVKVMVAPSLMLPEDPLLRKTAISTGLLGPNMVGLTLGRSIYMRSGHRSKRLLSHELRHVHQYERFGSISAFLSTYLGQVASYGYWAAPLEVDARKYEVCAQSTAGCFM